MDFGADSICSSLPSLPLDIGSAYNFAVETLHCHVLDRKSGTLFLKPMRSTINATTIMPSHNTGRKSTKRTSSPAEQLSLAMLVKTTRPPLPAHPHMSTHNSELARGRKRSASLAEMIEHSREVRRCKLSEQSSPVSSKKRASPIQHSRSLSSTPAQRAVAHHAPKKSHPVLDSEDYSAKIRLQQVPAPVAVMSGSNSYAEDNLPVFEHSNLERTVIVDPKWETHLYKGMPPRWTGSAMLSFRDLDTSNGVTQSPTFMIGLPCGGMIELAHWYQQDSPEEEAEAGAEHSHD